MSEQDSYSQFTVGLEVEKYTGEARWEGVIVARYLTTKGKLRFVVEVQPQGFQMIAVGAQLREKDRTVWVRRSQSKNYDGYMPDEPSPRQGHVVVSGDTFEVLAARYYQRACSWPVLATANALPDTNGDEPLEEGHMFWIPFLKTK